MPQLLPRFSPPSVGWHQSLWALSRVCPWYPSPLHSPEPLGGSSLSSSPLLETLLQLLPQSPLPGGDRELGNRLFPHRTQLPSSVRRAPSLPQPPPCLAMVCRPVCPSESPVEEGWSFSSVAGDNTARDEGHCTRAVRAPTRHGRDVPGVQCARTCALQKQRRGRGRDTQGWAHGPAFTPAGEQSHAGCEGAAPAVCRRRAGPHLLDDSLPPAQGTAPAASCVLTVTGACLVPFPTGPRALLTGEGQPVAALLTWGGHGPPCVLWDTQQHPWPLPLVL